jgi:hypothetical protein
VTEATAKWQLNYVRFKKKNIASDYTRTAWEKEHLQKVDDPEVFIFETQSVSYNFFTNQFYRA